MVTLATLITVSEISKRRCSTTRASLESLRKEETDMEKVVRIVVLATIIPDLEIFRKP